MIMTSHELATRRSSPAKSIRQRTSSGYRNPAPFTGKRVQEGAVSEFSPASARHPRPSRRTARTVALKTGLKANFAAYASRYSTT
jgi:hypothetical protein